MQVALKFDLPYSLDVNGTFDVPAVGENFSVAIETIDNANPNFPGAEHLENIAIVNDATNIIAHSAITATYTPRDPSIATWERLSVVVPALAIGISNMLVTAARVAHGEYFKDFIHQAKQLGPIQFRVIPSDGTRGFGGVIDALMGGITIRQPPRTGQSTQEFAQVLATGRLPTISQELLFDARRYKLNGNARMAVANLVMSFEIGLSDLLARIAVMRGDAALQTSIEQATIGELGQKFAKLTLGHSLEKATYWGADVTRRYLLLRETRNKILHRAMLSITLDGTVWDYSQESQLDDLFSEYEHLWAALTAAVDNILSGRPALP